MEAKRSKITSIRMDDDLLQRLAQLAHKKVMTKSQIINQILWQYAKWGAFGPSANLISFPKPLLVKIMDKLSEDEILQIARQHVKEDVEEIIRLATGDFSLKGFFEVLELWMKDSEMFYNHEKSSQEERFVINHNMSRNWSLFLGEVFRLIVEKLSNDQVNLRITNNTFTIIIKNEPNSKLK